VRLLLDVHHSPLVAEELQAAGHDVLAAADDPTLVTVTDEVLLRVATHTDRAVVTDNASDFSRIIRRWATSGEHHAGVIFHLPRRYHRGSAAYPANLIDALTSLLADPPADTTDLVHWLP